MNIGKELRRLQIDSDIVLEEVREYGNMKMLNFYIYTVVILPGFCSS